VNLRQKIIPLFRLPEWRAQVRREKKKLVATNGCFDLLHAGHVIYLEEARRHGDVLLVGLNGDAGVRELKGAGRPVNSEEDRATVLAALESVGAVCVFPEARASQFLAAAQPDVYVKGGDYTLDTLDAGERTVLQAAGAQIVLIPFVPGKSTTAVLSKLKAKPISR
jgi:D-glycero-beta-D-manno-heptose 1-phosphate adenylyltransferase